MVKNSYKGTFSDIVTYSNDTFSHQIAIQKNWRGLWQSNIKWNGRSFHTITNTSRNAVIQEAVVCIGSKELMDCYRLRNAEIIFADVLTGQI